MMLIELNILYRCLTSLARFKLLRAEACLIYKALVLKTLS